MNRVLIFTFFLCSLAGCSKQSVSTPPEAAAAQTAPSASPLVSPRAMAVAPTLAMPTPGNAAASPLVPPTSKDGKQAKVEAKPLPPDLWQRMTRPLSLEEINKLPPETRDMILRAQGRLPASPAPKKK